LKREREREREREAFAFLSVLILFLGDILWVFQIGSPTEGDWTRGVAVKARWCGVAMDES
jgi:hypothetical protein